MKITKYLLLIIQTILSFYYIFTNYEQSSISLLSPAFLIMLFVSIILILFYKRKNFQNGKKFNLFNVFLAIFMIPVILYILYIIVTVFFIFNDRYFNSSEYFIEYGIFTLIVANLNLIYLFLNLNYMKQQNNKLNDISSIIVSIIIILVHLRYYFDPAIIAYNEHGFSYIYVSQNYSYFSIMYIILITNCIINKKIMKTIR